MKILCVCEWGNVRSVTLARILHQRGHDTLSCGTERNSKETIEVLCNWADKIYITHDQLRSKIPNKFDEKIVDFNLGPDVWGIPHHEELVSKIKSKL